MSKTSESDPTGPYSCLDVGGGGLESQESATVPRKQGAHNAPCSKGGVGGIKHPEDRLPATVGET